MTDRFDPKQANQQKPDEPQLGEFPFPLKSGEEEPRYLRWIRNHSNYMAERGLLDYLRIVAVLVRGILINFLTLLPHLLVIGLVLALLHRTMVLHRFYLTGSVLALALAWILFFPIVTRLSDIRRYKKSRETGSGTSVKSRDLAERRLGGILLALLGAFLAESLQWALFRYHAEITVENTLIALAITGAALVIGSKLLPGLAGTAKTLAVLLVGGLGLLVPLLVVLDVMKYATDYPDEARRLELIMQIADLQFESGREEQTDLSARKVKLEREIKELKGQREVKSNIARYIQHFSALIVLPLVGAVCLLVAVGTGLKSGTLKSPIEALRILGWLILLLFLSFLLTRAVHEVFLYSTEDLPAVLKWARDQVVLERSFLLLGWALEIWLFCRLAVDVNRTSVHGLYRDRLASAYLIGVNTNEEVDIEEDVDLRDICCYEARSVAPYHLVNVALNLQGSKDEALRDRNSDFFVFSKRFIGGPRTGYCRSETMEMVHPSLSLGVAMAISAAAASPNMGRSTNPLAVAFMTLLNVRLGYWLPHPGRLVNELNWKATRKPPWKRLTWERKNEGGKPPWKRLTWEQPPWKRKGHRPGIHFVKVFAEEWHEIQTRWEQTYDEETERAGESDPVVPTTALGLIGLGFSGGGIRSATVNLGIAQALHRRGVFKHVDYLSTVSGGGYLGSSLSTLMRYRTSPVSEVAGKVQVSEKTVTITPEGTEPEAEPREYKYSYSQRAELMTAEGARVAKNSRLIRRPGADGDDPQATFGQQFRWRVPPSALGREMRMKLDETHKWVNLSDGGHIENLGCVELLRRRCKFIVLGDAESDPHLHFNALATLIRIARIDLRAEIDICVDDLRLDGNGRSRRHWALGRIKYAKEGEAKREHGWLLYLKSSFTGDEDEVIQEYRKNHQLFPHESTADQFFDEGQFEAYRALGQHIGEEALDALAQTPGGLKGPPDRFSRRADFGSSLEALWGSHRPGRVPTKTCGCR